MRATVGAMRMDLPSRWRDHSRYLFRSPDGDVRIEVSRVITADTAEGREFFDARVERAADFGPIRNEIESEIMVDGVVARTYQFEAGESDDATLFRILGVQVHPNEFILMFLTGPADRMDAIDAEWASVCGSLRIDRRSS